MSLRKRFTIKCSKVLVGIISNVLNREELKIIFMYLGRRLGFGLAIPCAKELEALCSGYDFSKNQEKIVVFDVGANIGEYTQATLERFGKVEIYAFEPNPRTCKHLQSKFHRYNNVHVYDYALGSEDTTGFISESRIFDPSSTVTKNSHEGCPVKILKLDSFAIEKNISSIDLLKIDAEGMDLEVLLGAQKLLTEIKVIQFEISPGTIQKAAFKDFFKLLSDTHTLHILAMSGLQRIEKYDFSDEVYWGANFVAFLKN